ncbi:hypothetical protein JOC95_000174 [Bacillus tianshenii]|uniref:Phage protein n=1 Tax=Sutcliffiella tianshenii TaxID=1463404 RepID=A0ABS2NV23_9BACI|nr:hypothetical protein [Bacillus tianshenii]MBM7618332.1 hypothetical protein [Bacillus tianshenii]
MGNETTLDELAEWEGLYRIRNYVVGSMTILKVGGKEVTTGSTPVYLDELSGEKFRFVTKVLLPENKEILLGLRFTLSQQTMDFKAYIKGVRINEKKKRYTYLVGLVMQDDKEIMSVITFVNKIQLANKQKKLRTITRTAIEVE